MLLDRPGSSDEKKAADTPDALSDWKDRMDYPFMRTVSPFGQGEALRKMLGAIGGKSVWLNWLVKLAVILLLGWFFYMAIAGVIRAALSG